MGALLAKLAGGDRRSVGRTDEVVDDVLADPARVAELFDGLDGDDPIIRMRAADAIEKASRRQPALLGPYKARVLHHLATAAQPEVQWHTAQMAVRLALSDEEVASAVARLKHLFAESASRIARANAIDALAQLADTRPSLKAEVKRLVAAALASETPAVSARARKVVRTKPWCRG